METSREVNEVSEQKIEQFWRPATADDVARVMRGERIEARFRKHASQLWTDGFLYGWTFADPQWYCISSGTSFYNDCQVYDPPEWFVNNPDPGEGWRLLEKFPHEDLLPTDEANWPCDGKWHVHKEGSGKQIEEMWYRRRIADTSETPNSCRSIDNIPSGWRVLGKDEERLASDAYWSQGAKDWIIIGDDRVGVANSQKLHAIRQMDRATEFYLHDSCHYKLPNGQTIRVTAKGFEVL